jgi:small subunit ribosomal protein S7
MSRRRAAQRREVLPDPKFGDTTITRFMNCLMYSGKKSAAETAVYGALEHIQKRTGQDPIKIFHGALDNVRPAVEVRSRRVGGATYQVPVEVRTEHTMTERLSAELLEAANNRGTAVKKREDTHRMADANRAFSHYRW